MSWMSTDICPVCGADGFDPDCDEVDVGVGAIEGNLRGRCRVCGEVAQVEREGESGWEVERPLRRGDPVSTLVTWPNGQAIRTIGTMILLRRGEVYLESELGPVVGPARSLERED